MTLLELNVELGRVADALDKIVFLLEKLVYPPPPADVKVYQATLDDLHTVAPEDVERIRQEQLAFAERYQVVPDSEAMIQACVEWVETQRSIYGETWQPPKEDWRTLISELQRSQGAGGERSHPGSTPTAEAAAKG